MSRHVSLLLLAYLITLQVGGSLSICLMVPPSSIKALKWDHKISDMNNEKDERFPIRLLKRAVRMENGVFLKTKRNTGETIKGQNNNNVLNEFNDWAMMQNGGLWDDNLIRRMKKGLRSSKRIKADTLVRMI